MANVLFDFKSWQPYLKLPLTHYDVLMYDDKEASLLESISSILKEAQCNLAVRSTKKAFSYFL